uniref:Uncharacterized protein n=1 Tax=Crocodylus porosus TaxID=8502 RepID=A0A7M4F9K1_CROPO
QLHLHLVPHQIRGLPPLPTLQVVGGDGVGHLGGVERPLQPHLLRGQQLGLGRQVLDLLLQLRLPEVQVLQALAHQGGGLLLRALGQRGRGGGQAPGLAAAALRAVAVGEGVVVLRIVALVPLLGQVLGRAEAGRGQPAGRVRARVQSHLVQLRGQLAPNCGMNFCRASGPGQSSPLSPSKSPPLTLPFLTYTCSKVSRL